MGVFTSGLSTDEFVALSSVGFDPVGQVMGSSVYHLGYLPNFCNAGFLGMGSPSTQPLPTYQSAVLQARDFALGRLVHECWTRGGDGVVAVDLRVRRFPDSDRVFEFTAQGTAVRARSATRPARPFTADLSGQHFAALVRSGYIPTGIAFGISAAVRHDDWRTQSINSIFAGNQEIPGYSELIGCARHWARQEFSAALARTGGEFGVVREMELEVFEVERSENHRDHCALATLIGTGVTRFADTPVAPPGLTMMRL